MKIEHLSIDGAFIIESPIHSDDRGFFREWFKDDLIEKVLGRNFEVAQANISTSSRGTLRGLHYSLAPNGQAKLVTCVSGSVKDVIVDIRPDSKTFGEWVEVELIGNSGKAIYISEGLGHGFISLTDSSSVAYLLSTPYSPTEEFEINPLDPAIGINWGFLISELKISNKDKNAPTLEECKKEGKLPIMSKR
jgi:dTDP-4-dehydrorhamnose 3,5-epimerase